MGLDDVINGIDEEARAEVEAILRSAREQAASILSEARARTESEIASMEHALEREVVDVRNIQLSDAKRKARQSLLCAKEELIWDTLSEVRKRLAGLDGKDLNKVLEGLIVTAKDSLGDDAEVFAVRETDARILRSRGMVIAGVLESMAEPREKVKRYMGRDLIGGIIVFSSDGNRMLDLTFQGLLDRDSERIRERISEILFED